MTFCRSAVCSQCLKNVVRLWWLYSMDVVTLLHCCQHSYMVGLLVMWLNSGQMAYDSSWGGGWPNLRSYCIMGVCELSEWSLLCPLLIFIHMFIARTVECSQAVLALCWNVSVQGSLEVLQWGMLVFYC